MASLEFFISKADITITKIVFPSTCKLKLSCHITGIKRKKKKTPNHLVTPVEV